MSFGKTFFTCVAVVLGIDRVASSAESSTIVLSTGWKIQSSVNIASDGQAISSDSFIPAGWHPATVPETVLSALVKDGTYTNIYFGTNLAAIPTAPFTNTWWYRTGFNLSATQAAQDGRLTFNGINYRANIWLNGKQLAGADQTFGAFRVFHFDVSGQLKPGKNVLAVEVFPPKPGDFTLGFVDWNPKPADRGMGLFRPVQLHLYQDVMLENVFVKSKIDHVDWQSAQLTIQADLSNHSSHPVETTVNGEIVDNGDKIPFSEKIVLLPGEKRLLELTSDEIPQLKLVHVQLWWPWELGNPHLYRLKLTASEAGNVCDTEIIRFGIREVSDYITADGYRGYIVNGRKLLLRGGGWADELLLDEDPQRLAAQVQYTKAMNLNTIRLEGIWGSSQRLYDLADENGLLIMAGFSCQWEWTDMLGKDCDKYGGFKSSADILLATNYLHDQVLWLRNHPSILMWVLGSDKLPRPELETNYDALLAVVDPTRPKLKTCGDDASEVSGPSAVKMNGPYDYVTPDYWYLDTKNGGAFGFNTETGPGPQPPPLESLQRMLPADHLWPIDNVWSFHCARGQFGHLTRYLNAYTNRYGAPISVSEFAFKAQAANYEAMRAMYEAFAVNLPHTTGIIQWMLNPSWPKLYWQLYDYYLVPGGAFFGAKRGAAPVAVIYNYGDQGVYLVNQTGKSFGDSQTTITVYDSNSKKLLDQTVTNTGAAYGAQKIFDLSHLSSDTPVYFLDLHTANDFGSAASADNFYWLSTKPDILDESKTQWYVTPNQSFADFTSLNRLPTATVEAGVSFLPAGGSTEAQVTLTNTGDTLAFFIEMKIVGLRSQQSLTPVFWDDNYVSLPPHATKTFHAHFPKGERPELKLQGWNVKFDDITGSNLVKL